MTSSTDPDQPTSNDPSNENKAESLSPEEYQDRSDFTEIELIDIDNCSASLVCQDIDDGTLSGFITFGYTGELHDLSDLRAAIYQVYQATYQTPQETRPKLFKSFAEDCPVGKAYNIDDNLYNAAHLGSQDHKHNRQKRTKQEVCKAILSD